MLHFLSAGLLFNPLDACMYVGTIKFKDVSNESRFEEKKNFFLIHSLMTFIASGVIIGRETVHHSSSRKCDINIDD